MRLIYVANNFTAYVQLLGLFVGDHTLGGGQHGNAQAVEDAGHGGYIGVLAQTGGAHALDALDSGGFGLRVVLEGDFDGVDGAGLHYLVAEDVALFAQNLGDGELHVGSGDFHHFLTGEVSVTDSGQEICNGISHFFVF